MTVKRLNIGCGHIYLKGYTRVDIDPGTDPDVCCDTMCLNEHFKDNTVLEIRASHLLEHISPGTDCFNVLRVWWNALQPGGFIEIIVPDVGFAKEHGNWDVFEKTVLGGDPTATEFMLHRNVFSDKKLMRFLTITGFIDIENLSKPGSMVLHIRGYKPMKKSKKKVNNERTYNALKRSTRPLDNSVFCCNNRDPLNDPVQQYCM